MKVKMLLFKLESPLLTMNPMIISGSACYHAIAGKLGYKISKNINVSNMVLQSISYRYFGLNEIDGLPKKGGRIVSPSNLKIDKYSDFMAYRRPSVRAFEGGYDELSKFDFSIQNWGKREYCLMTPDTGLSEASSKDGKVDKYGYVERERTRRVPKQIFGNIYLTGDNIDSIDDQKIENMSIGARRNTGYGMFKLHKSKTIDTNDIEFDISEPKWVELASPYCLNSEFPGVDQKTLPSWFEAKYGYRTRKTELFHRTELGPKKFELECIDVGHVFKLTNPNIDPYKGVKRTGSHIKYGFGEWYLL